MPFNSIEEFIDEAFIRAFPGKSQETKGVFRFELEAMVEAALTRLGLKVAAGADYRALQRSLIVQLNQGAQPLTFTRVVHPTSGLNTGLDIFEAYLYPQANNVYAVAAQQLVPSDTGFLTDCAVEVGVVGVMRQLTIAFRPLDKLAQFPLDQADIDNLLALQVDAGGQITVRQQGNTIGFGLQALLDGQRLRAVFGADGGLEIRTLSAGGTEVSAIVQGSYVPISVPVGLVFWFPDAGTLAVEPVILKGLSTVVALPPNHRLILDSVRRQGGVDFVNSDPLDLGQPLTFLDDPAYARFPRLPTLYYWSWDTVPVEGSTGAAIRLYPGDRTAAPPSSTLRIRGNVVPGWADVPDFLREAAVVSLMEVARERTMMGAQVAKSVKR